jgi:hypothetical protein
LQINTCVIYYTTDESNPEGSFGVGQGTTRVVQGVWTNHDSGQSTIDWWKGVIPAQADQVKVRYKIALFNGGSVPGYSSIPPISDASDARQFGLTQFGVTNFNPVTARVWLHNDLNPANTVTGLPSGFHIVRARAFLPRAGKSAVYNTFSQTFYYDAALPGGVIASPAVDGSDLTNSSYTVVVRADASVTAVDYNIQDSLGSGLSNGVPVFAAATPASPDPALSAQYPAYPQEFRFSYPIVPASGTATITARLKSPASAVYTNRLTVLTRTVQTLAPAQVVEISSPATDGMIIPMSDGSVYLIHICFTANLTVTNAELFALTINGALQPRSEYLFRPPGSVAGCPGLRSILYNWSGAAPGTNVIQITFTNQLLTLSDVRTVIVPPPLLITGYPSSSDPLIVWDSTPGLNYLVLATTNLSEPFVPVSPVIPAGGLSTFYYDDSPGAPQKFYIIQTLP